MITAQKHCSMKVQYFTWVKVEKEMEMTGVRDIHIILSTKIAARIRHFVLNFE